MQERSFETIQKAWLYKKKIYQFLKNFRPEKGPISGTFEFGTKQKVFIYHMVISNETP